MKVPTTSLLGDQGELSFPDTITIGGGAEGHPQPESDPDAAKPRTPHKPDKLPRKLPPPKQERETVDHLLPGGSHPPIEETVLESDLPSWAKVEILRMLFTRSPK